MAMRVSQFALGFCTSVIFISLFRWLGEFWQSDQIRQNAMRISIQSQTFKMPTIRDKPVEFDAEMNSQTLNPEVKHRLVDIEERQDKVKAAGDKRLSNLELIHQMNRDPLPTKSAFETKNADEICQGEDSKKCLPKFLNLESKMRTAAQYKLSVCVIQKSMSTVLAALMCYLHDEHNFTAAGRSFRHEYSNDRLCLKQNEFKSVEESITNQTIEDWTLLTAVREPIDRFLSGYVDKCIRSPTRINFCNNCWANMTCFIQSEYERFMQQSNSSLLKRTFEDRHFAPQNWHCRFDKNFNKFEIIRYSGASENGILSFGRQLFRLLSLQSVPQNSLDFIRFQMDGDRTIHSTINSEARQFFEKRLRSSPYLMEYVLRMFYYDFEVFGFERPKLEFK